MRSGTAPGGTRQAAEPADNTLGLTLEATGQTNCRPDSSDFSVTQILGRSEQKLFFSHQRGFWPFLQLIRGRWLTKKTVWLGPFPGANAVFRICELCCV